ncbi:MAG: CBS domain-containing protein [Weeksellaceae bacterium]
MENNLLKTVGILRASPTDTLSSAVAQVVNSHDAVFIFDESDHFHGVINPYYTLIQSSYPAGTKVERCLFHPPRIAPTDTIERIAQMMKESKIHYLPVFDDKNKFLGITTARRVMQTMLGHTVVKQTLAQVLENKQKPLISVYETDAISQALHLFKEHKISKLVVIKKDLKLQGILSYFDLIPYLIAPGRKEKAGNRSGEKVQFGDMKVKNFMKTATLTCGPEHTVEDAINTMLKQHIGSIVVVDQQNNPMGIVTIKDILHLLADTGSDNDTSVVVKHGSEAVDRYVRDLESFLEEHMTHHPQVKETQIVVDEMKEGKLHKLAVHIQYHHGDPAVVEREGRDLPDMVKDIKHAITNLHRS